MTYRSEGLTRSKLLFGCDDFETTDLDNFYGNDLDPEIETFQMISMMPLQFLKLNFFRKENRDMMRIVVCGEEDKPMFFEFGGHLFKNVSNSSVPRLHLHFHIFWLVILEYLARTCIHNTFIASKSCAYKWIVCFLQLRCLSGRGSLSGADS